MSSFWVPDDVDVETPSAARLYDYYLGGHYNFAADRTLAERVYQVFPQTPYLARENRAFLRRASSYLARQGFTQFIDIGCGLPTSGPLHEVVQNINPESRVVYVDNEPVAYAHSELLLKDVPNTDVLRADLVEPESILDSAVTRGLLDLRKPVGVLMVAVMHFVGDEHDPAGIMRRYRDLLPVGSSVVFSHVSGDTLPDVERAAELYKNSQNPVYLRTKSEIAKILADYDLVDPGLVFLPEWKPEHPEDAEDAAACSFYSAVGMCR